MPHKPAKLNMHHRNSSKPRPMVSGGFFFFFLTDVMLLLLLLLTLKSRQMKECLLLETGEHVCIDRQIEGWAFCTKDSLLSFVCAPLQRPHSLSWNKQTSIPQLFFPSAVLWGKWKWWWGKIVFCCSPNPRSAGLVRSAGLAISPLSVPTHFTDRSYPFVNLSSAISICTNVASETFKHFLQQLTCLAVKGLTLFMDVLVSFFFFSFFLRGEKNTHCIFYLFIFLLEFITSLTYCIHANQFPMIGPRARKSNTIYSISSRCEQFLL